MHLINYVYSSVTPPPRYRNGMAMLPDPSSAPYLNKNGGTAEVGLGTRLAMANYSILTRLKDHCCVEMVEKERIISVSTTRPDLMEEATSEDFKGNLSKQVMISVVTVRRPLKGLRDAKKVAPPGIKPRTSGFSCHCSSH